MRYLSWSFLVLVVLAGFNVVTATESGHSHKHHHGQVEISSWPEKPGVTLKVTKDAVAGWNIFLETENFRFAPENVNKQTLPNEGHAHLYVDGEKVARLYGPWFHLGKLSPGQHAIQVTLNANNHDTLVLHGRPVAANTAIVQ
jgi:hypothetical protein